MSLPLRDATSPGDRFPAFRSTNFRRLFANAVFAEAAHWAQMLARGWLVFELTDSNTAVGIVTFAGMAPFLFASPVAGALADRIDRRRLSLWAAAIGFVAAAALAAVTLAGVVAVWHVALLALLGGIARAGQRPAEQAMLPNLVPRSALLNAVSLGGISRHGSRIVGPLFGAVLLSTIGAGAVFALAALLIVVGATQLWRIDYRSAIRSEEANEGGAVAVLLRDIGEGMRYIGKDPRVALVLVLVVFHCALTMAFDSLMPQLAVTVGGDDRTYSAILMGLGAGAIAGTLWVSMLPGEAAQGRALAITGLGSGLALLVLGTAGSPAMAVFGAMLAGGTQASYMALSATLVQSVTPDALRGRVMSIYVMLAAGHMAFVNLGFGAWADIIGVRPLLIVPGLIWTALFLLATVALVDLRHLLRHGAFLHVPVVAGIDSEADAARAAGG